MTEPDPRRPPSWAVTILGLILVAGVAVDVYCLRFFPEPYPVDSIYYYDVARSIAGGRGMVVDYAWDYARGVPEQFPVPSNAYWNPGLCFYLVPWLKLLGPRFISAQIANIGLTIPFLALVWWVGRELAGGEVAGLLAAGLVAVEPHFVYTTASADPGPLHSLLLAAGLLCIHYGLRRGPRWLVLAGLLGGAAYLVRNDGVLILPVFAVTLVVASRGADRRTWAGRALLFLGAYAAVVAPWLIRNTVVFGSPAPPHLTRLLFLPDYNDIFRVDWSALTPSAYLEARGGFVGLLTHRLGMLWRFARWSVVEGGGWTLALAAPVLWGRRPALSRPYLMMLAVLFATYTLILPEIGWRGAYGRTFPSLYPLIFGAAGGAIAVAGACVATRWRGVSRGFVVALIGIVLLWCSALRLIDGLPEHHWSSICDPYAANARVLRPVLRDQLGDLPLFTDDAWRLQPLAGRPVLQIPTDGMGAVHDVARRVGIRHVVMKGSCIGYCPGLENAIDSGDVSVLLTLETAECYEGLHVMELVGSPPGVRGAEP